jgi:membrane protease YdiL (CAAX protease family)
VDATLSFARRHPLAAFFGLAYAVTWLAVVPYALGAFPVPVFTFGPFVAALALAALTDGRPGVRALLGTLVRWRVGLRWYALALLLPLAVALGATYASVRLGAPDPTAVLLAALPGFPLLFAGLLLSPFSGAFGEELGWRGYALPRLLATRSPLAASLLLGVLAAGWHAPLFLAGIYAHPALHVAQIVATTVLWTLLHRGTGGSVLLAMLFHASWNATAAFLLGPFAGADLARAMTLFLLGGIGAAAAATALSWRWLASATAPPPRHAAATTPAAGTPAA